MLDNIKNHSGWISDHEVPLPPFFILQIERNINPQVLSISYILFQNHKPQKRKQFLYLDKNHAKYLVGFQDQATYRQALYPMNV